MTICDAHRERAGRLRCCDTIPLTVACWNTKTQQCWVQTQYRLCMKYFITLKTKSLVCTWKIRNLGLWSPIFKITICQCPQLLSEIFSFHNRIMVSCKICQRKWVVQLSETDSGRFNSESAISTHQCVRVSHGLAEPSSISTERVSVYEIESTVSFSWLACTYANVSLLQPEQLTWLKGCYPDLHTHHTSIHCEQTHTQDKVSHSNMKRQEQAHKG